MPRISSRSGPIRDHGYLVNTKITVKTNSEIPDNQLVTLINYDVSNVDNLYLPLAMEATDVWVIPQQSGPPPNPNREGWKPGSDPDVYGWIGADNTIDFLQTHLRAFTADNNQLLGKYFKDGKGWPFYNIPNPTNDPNTPIKIPSGANVFAQSPIRGIGVVSSYSTGEWQTDKYMLSSGGTKPRAATIGWAGSPPDGDPAGSTTLHVNLAESDRIAFIEKDYLVTGRPPESPPTPNPIQPGTTVLGVDKTAGAVTLSQPLLHSSKACAFTFSARRRLRLRRHDQTLVFVGSIVPEALEGPHARRSHVADADHRIHRGQYGDADFYHSAPRAG